MKIPKRTYYYQIKNFDKKKDKDKEITKLIKEIFKKHRGKYGYLRITMDLNNKGYKINKKKVQRIMQKNSLFAKQKKRKFHSFQGVVGKICDNILNREFKSTMPYQKLGTDVTQFSIKGEKIYFAPLIDFFTREILGYNISRNPNIKQQRDMIKDAYKKHGEKLNYSLIHSDQGKHLLIENFLKKYMLLNLCLEEGIVLIIVQQKICLAELKLKCFMISNLNLKMLNNLLLN